MRTRIGLSLIFIIVTGLTIESPAHARSIEKIALRVNSEYYTYSEFLNYYVPFIRLASAKNPDEKFLQGARQEILRLLVQSLVIMDMAAENNVTISDLQIAASMKAYLQSMNTTEAEFRRRIEQESEQPLTMDLWKLQQKIQLAQEHLIAKMQNEQVKIPTITQEDIQKCYQKTVMANSAGEKRTLSHIVLLLNNPNDLTEVRKAIERLDAAVEELQSGKPFAEVARTYNQDKETRSTDGMIATLFKEEWSTHSKDIGLDYGKYGYELKEGEYSDILQGKSSLHLIYVDKVFADTRMTIDEAREGCIRIIRQQRYLDLLNERVQKRLREAKIDININ